MCQFKSAIILKDRVFIPDYDSHSDMLKELGIADTKENAERLFIRAELIPIGNDVFSDISTWKFNVDQDILPDWYVEEYDKQRMIEAVKEWAKDRIHIGKENFVISDGAGHYIKDCTDVKIHGSAQVGEICGDTIVNSIDGYSNTRIICGNATVDSICGNATVDYICGNATVDSICGNATVDYIYVNATVNRIYGNATVDSIYGSATVDSIYDSARVNNIYGSATVDSICDSATVDSIYGSATVDSIYDSATVDSIYGSATVITSRLLKWRNLNKAKLQDDATIKDRYAKTIYQAGDWQLKPVGESQG